MEVRLFGQLEVVQEGVEMPVRGTKQRALLALLALQRGQPVSADRLIDALWGDGQAANPANALQAQIGQLRRTFGAAAIVTTEAGYALAAGPDEVDVVRFEQLVAKGRRLAADGEMAPASTTTCRAPAYVGLPTDTYPPLRLAARDSQGAETTAPFTQYRPRGTTMNTPTGPPAQSETRAGDGSGAAPPAPPRQTMQAIVQAGYGSADVLRRAEIDKPVIGDDEVLIRVQAAGLDRGTWHLMTGKPYLIRLVSGLRTPKNPVPGLDVAGTVVTTGAAVTRFKAGDQVFGIAKGSFAEYAPARQDKLVSKPANLSFEQAAAVAVSGLTALQGLRDAGHLQQGQHVLIIGASGGVGTFAVQIAKALGAEVTGVCSAAKTGLVASIGADHVVDYAKNDFADGTQRYDLILDLAGNTPLHRLRQALTPAGTLVIAGGEDAGRWTGMGRQVRAMALSPFVHQRLTSLLSRQRQADLEHLAQLIEAGQLTPVIGNTYPLHQAPDAMRDLRDGRARGKLVITVAPTG